MMRAGALILATVAAWSPLRAQVASVAIFAPLLQSAVSEADSARTSTTSDFALYELGRRQRPDGTAVTPENAIGVLRATLTSQQVSTVCGTTRQAPPRLLTAQASAGRRAFWPLIADAECRYGLPSGLMDSVVLAESRYDPRIVSPAGAAGLAQLMPGTAMDLGVADRFDPASNVQAGAHYLRQLLDSFEGNVPLALAAYNAGPAAVRRVQGIPVNGETPGYVHRVLAYWTAPGIGPMSSLLSARQTAQMLGFGPTLTN